MLEALLGFLCVFKSNTVTFSLDKSERKEGRREGETMGEGKGEKDLQLHLLRE